MKNDDFGATRPPPPPIPEWRCYGRTAMDSSHKHWDKKTPLPLSCGQSNTALRADLAAVFASSSACESVKPGSVAYPAETWTVWNDVRPSDLTTSRKNKNDSSTVGAYYCQGYPNQYLDPIQHLVMAFRVGGVLAGNSTNITVEIRPIKPAGATYQITAMVAPVTGGTSLSIPMMLARENLTTASSHLGPQVSASAVRPLVTEHEHNSLVFQALPQNKKTPKKIQVVQGYHGGNDVQGWLEGARSLVGFGATGAKSRTNGQLCFEFVH